MRPATMSSDVFEVFSCPPKKANEQLNSGAALLPDWMFGTFEVDLSNDNTLG